MCCRGSIRAGRWLAVALVAWAARLPAQNPDLILSQAERDSILATYNNTFPIWGRKAIERGFDLPAPGGISLIFVAANQGLLLHNLGLSTGENPTVPIEVVQFGDVKAPVLTTNIRGDLWVLPFLNVYALGGYAWVETDVTLTEPVAFQTVVNQTGQYVGLGMTATMGIKHNWLALDLNWSWTDTEKVDQPVRGRIFGIRYGRAQKLSGGRRLAVWLGAMQQKFASETDGSIPLSEVIDDGAEAQLQAALPGYQLSPWYSQLGASQKQLVDTIATRIQQGRFDDVIVNYSLEKATIDPWNMIAGLSYDASKSWQYRVEFGFIGRRQLMLQANYRFNW